MKKMLVSIIIIIFLLFCGYEILSDSESIINTVNYSIDIWIHNLFPSMFPFFVLSQILIHYGFIELMGELFKPIFERLFKISGNASFIFFMSMLSGFPSNAKYTKEAYLEGNLTKDEANKILMFSHFSNPLFILGTVSLTFLNNKKLGILVLISHYLANIIIGLILRNYKPSKINKEKFSLSKAIIKMHNKRIHNKVSFGKMFANSLMNSIDTLLLILGVVTTFLILTTILDNNFSLNPFYKTIITGLLEMTQGLKNISLLNISNYLKGVIAVSILSFGGLSVHTQVISIISDTDLKYLPFLIARILHVIISIFLFFVFNYYI